MAGGDLDARTFRRWFAARRAASSGVPDTSWWLGAGLIACSDGRWDLYADETVDPTSTLVPEKFAPIPTAARVTVVVVIPDSSLQAAVRLALGKPTGDITDLDMLGLTEFTAVGQGISDMTGFCQNSVLLGKLLLE